MRVAWGRENIIHLLLLLGLSGQPAARSFESASWPAVSCVHAVLGTMEGRLRYGEEGPLWAHRLLEDET